MQARFGIEKEYLLGVEGAEGFGYLLAAPEIVDTLYSKPGSSVQKLFNDGWRVEPEYGRSIIEVVSPPVSTAMSEQLIAGFANFERSLAEIASSKVKQPVILSDRIGSITDRFYQTNGKQVTAWDKILLKPGREKKILTIAQNNADAACQYAGSIDAAARSYAGFISTHITISWQGHPALDSNALVLDSCWPQLVWQLFSRSLQLDVAESCQNIFDGTAGKFTLTQSPRKSFLSWMDNAGNQMREGCVNAAQSSELALSLFKAVYGTGPYTDDSLDAVKNYGIQPRIQNNQLLIEFRHFAGEMPVDRACAIAAELLSFWVKWE